MRCKVHLQRRKGGFDTLSSLSSTPIMIRRRNSVWVLYHIDVTPHSDYPVVLFILTIYPPPIPRWKRQRRERYVWVSLYIVPIVYHLVSHKMPYHYYPDISFHIRWMKGWTFKRGTGLISWYYLIPGCETIHRGKEGVEYFTSERDAYAAYKRMRSINSEE